jgi:hypothetical protein
MPTLSINCRYLYNVVQTLSVHTLRFCVVSLHTWRLFFPYR